MADNLNERSLEERILEAHQVMIVNLILNTNRIAEKLRCNPSDLQVFHAVELAGAITPKELAERTNLTTGGITVVLDRLEKENLIKREKHPTDRRSVLITVNSSERRREVNAAYKQYGEKFLEILAQYSEKDLNTILGFLEKLNM